MFNKKKKKPQISLPSNFEHRVHTGFDKREGRYVGLPLQWASIVGNNQILKSTNRPLPLVDPSEITQTEILDLKTIVRPHFNNNSKIDESTVSNTSGNGLLLPKTSHVARSNSLRSSSPPKIRRDLRGNANVPPSVPEEQSTASTPTPSQHGQFSSMRREPMPPPNINNQGKPMMQHPQQQQQQHQTIIPIDWNRQYPGQIPPTHGNQFNMNDQQQSTNLYGSNTNGEPKNLNGNTSVTNPIAVHTELSTPYYR